MADLFVYGTLLDPELLRRILGRDIRRLRMRPASAGGVRKMRVKGRAYPTLRPDAGATVDGRLVEGLTAGDMARLGRYEGPEYRLVDLDVRLGDGATRRTRAYATRPGVPVVPM